MPIPTMPTRRRCWVRLADLVMWLRIALKPKTATIQASSGQCYAFTLWKELMKSIDSSTLQLLWYDADMREERLREIVRLVQRKVTAALHVKKYGRSPISLFALHLALTRDCLQPNILGLSAAPQ